MTDWPTLGSFDSGVKHLSTILAFEALRMEISIQSSNSWRFGLSFFRNYWLRTHRTNKGKQLCIAFWTVNSSFIICRELFSNQTLLTSLTFEACWMKTCSSNLDMFSFNLRIAPNAGIVHVIHVVLLAVHLAIQLIIGAFYRVLAYATDTLAQLEISLTNWFVLKKQIGSS